MPSLIFTAGLGVIFTAGLGVISTAGLGVIFTAGIGIISSLRIIFMAGPGVIFGAILNTLGNLEPFWNHFGTVFRLSLRHLQVSIFRRPNL